MLKTSWRSGNSSLMFTHAWDHAPNILLIMLGRFEHRGRRGRKLTHVVDVPTKLRIPVFPGQGMGIHQEEYNPRAGAIHVGDQAHTGHCRAFSVTRAPRCGEGQMPRPFSVLLGTSL